MAVEYRHVDKGLDGSERLTTQYLLAHDFCTCQVRRALDALILRSSMSPEDFPEKSAPKSLLSGLHRGSSGNDRAAGASNEAVTEKATIEISVDEAQASEPLSGQREAEQAEQDFCHRIRVELDRDRARDERFEAAESLIDQLRNCSPTVVETLLETVSDLANADADLESRKVAFQLLEAVATQLEHSTIRAKVFDMITVLVDHRLAYAQISALDQLLQQGRNPKGLERHLGPFLNSVLIGLFNSAEKARQKRHKEQETMASNQAEPSKQRPGEEKALLKCLSLITNLIESEQNAFDADDRKVLLTSVTKLAGQTTGFGLMRGFFHIISACGILSKIPLTNLESCLRLLCFVMSDERYKAKEDARTSISTVLRSDTEGSSVSILLGCIVADPSQPEAVRSSVLQLVSHSFRIDHRSDIEKQVFSKHLRACCHTLKSEPEVPSILADPLVDLLSSCDPHVDPETFGTLLESIGDVLHCSSKDRMANKPVSLHMIESLIRVFLDNFVQLGCQSIKIYEMVICIAKVASSPSSRLAAMKFLARLRCDADYGMKVVKVPDTQGLAAVLCRTKTTASAFRLSSSPSSQASSQEHTPPSKRAQSRNSDALHRGRSRSGNRHASPRDRFQVAKEPLWVYDEKKKGLPVEPPLSTSNAVYARSPKNKVSQKHLIDLGLWLEIMIYELETGSHWELYTYILVHLPSQLSNCSLFQDHPRQISDLHELLNSQLSGNSFPEPPSNSGIRRGDIALCLYHSMTVLLAYQDFIGVRQWNRTVSTFRAGIEKWDRVGNFCIHALTICCYEVPNIIENHLSVIIEMMQKRITQSDLAIDILEFLGGLARIPEAYDKSDVELHQKIFGICIRYLQHAREQRKAQANDNIIRATSASNRASGNSGDGFRLARQSQIGPERMNLHEYVFTIAYQVMIFWFLAINVRERARHVAWITRELTWKTESGREEMEQQSMVFLDMMHRTTFSDLGETYSDPQFVGPDRKICRGRWLVGMSIITAEVVVDEVTNRTGCGQFTKRQASGTTHAVYYHNTEDTPGHQVPETATSAEFSLDRFDLYPNHMVLQLISTISPVPAPLQPIPLPDDETTNRTLRLFDATDTVDGHKAAVIYIGPGQTEENTILANTSGSSAYEAFLSKVGYRVSLQDAKFNTQGLDRQYGTDGSHTYAWRDRVAEIVFHVPTIMPNDLGNNASCTRKKSHVGNDHVKIVFNDSGVAYRPDTFASDFNSVNIIITPEADSRGQIQIQDGEMGQPQSSPQHEPSDTDRFGYYHVQVITSDRYPDFSPAASVKIISACGLPLFVRQLAMTASVFCQVWPRNLGEYISSWRFRLQQIIKLRERFANANASANIDYPQAADTDPLAFVEGESWSGTVTYGGMAEANSLMSNLDFTRWTK